MTPPSWIRSVLGFRNRGAWLRLALVFLPLIGLTLTAELAWEYPVPNLKDCLDDPEQYHGRTVWVGPARVLQRDGDAATLKGLRGFPVRLTECPEDLAVGEQIVVRGIFHRDRKIVLDRADGVPALRRSPNGMKHRQGMFVISFAVLIYMFWRFLHYFRIRGGQIDLRAHD